MKLNQETIERVTGDFREAKLGDPRRNRRIESVVGKLAQAPGKSLPDAMASESELEGAYRIINNSRVTMQELLRSHAEATKRRAIEANQVLVIHDTTTCQFVHADPKEVGYLSTGKPGFFAHAALVVDAAKWRRPLGVIHTETLHRKRRSGRGSRKRKVSGTESAKWKDRESQRWLRGIEKSRERLKDCETVIHVADREGDSYENLGRMDKAGDRFVFRINHDRRADMDDNTEQETTTVKAIARSICGQLQREVPLSSRKSTDAILRSKKTYPPRKSRIATLQFSATPVTIHRPRYLDDSVDAELRLNVVHVIEPSPPDGEVAVEWFLYTTEPIQTAEQIAAVVDIYRTRWLIEEFFKALKSGCIYEQRQFESRDALLTLLALSLPIANEILWLRSLARTEPVAPATHVLTPLQITILCRLGSRKLPKNPTVRDALWAVAGLGGHIKCNGEPGWLVLQRGMTKLLDYERAWRAAREGK